MRSPISIQSSPKSSSPLVHSGLLQRKCACGNSAKLTGQCNECDRQKLTLQRQTSGQQEHTEVPEIVHEVLNFPGQPLDPATRTFMESRFGHDFSQVRVHTDAQAAVSAQAVGALAYTVKPNIVFGTGQYAPHTREGQRLLAHELTHILQQQSNALRPQAKLTISSPGDASEREADRMATIVSQQQSHRHFNPVKDKLQRRTIFEGIAGLFSGDSFKEEELQSYLMTLDKTGKIEDFTESDNKARAIVNAWRSGGSPYILTALRKALLILEMQSGFTGDDDEQAILEILERSYNFELSNIFGTGGVKVKDLNSDFHGEEWDRLQNFYERRFRGGMDVLLKGKIEPQGLPVSLGTSLSGVTNILMLEELPGAKPEWNVPCLLGILCPLDKVVVDQLPNLKVQKADKVTEVYWVFDGKTWVMKTRERGAFSDANQGVIGLKTQADCPTAAEYIIHEVRHQNQPADLKIPQTEIDAYTFEEEWAIKRGLPGTPDFRTQKPGTQEEIPNSPKIEAYVRKRYSGITSTPGDSLIGHTPTNEAKVRKPNGSEYTRPAQQGEEHQDYEKTKANLNNLPKVNSSEWVCPKTKTTP